MECHGLLYSGLWLKIHAVGVIFENEYGQILVLRRHPQDPEGTTWGLVGGKVKANENVIAAAIREVQEEIGHIVDPTRLRFLKTYHWDRDDLDITFEVFKLPSLTREITLEINQVEHTEHLWATPQELYQRKDLMMGLYPIIKETYELG